jgi:hypothetical protein
MLQLDVLRLGRTSWIHTRSERLVRQSEGVEEHFYPVRFDPGERWQSHLLFALKHEGVALEVLAALFRQVSADDMSAQVRSAPTGKYARLAWFLYEWLTGRILPVPDLKQGNYFPILPESDCYCLPRDAAARTVQRQRVIDNLPGTPAYCPLVRRTEELRRMELSRLDERAAAQMQRYPADLLLRASQYLYVKETKSSFAIEHLSPDQRRTARFVELLREAGKVDCYSEAELVALQRAILEERYAAAGFRDSQNYVGESLGLTRELIHYVPPKPGDLRALMEGWMNCCKRLEAGKVHPIVTATVAGFGFVFLHPFEDGNGRLHRFLLHHALAATGFAPPGIVFPVSATMLKQLDRYDAALEAFSRRIGEHVEYTLSDQGAMEVTNDTAAFYRYPDLTPQAEALFGFVRDTIDTEMVVELEYLAAFDSARRRMLRVVDMPDRRLDLFLRLCLQGNGHLSKSKRHTFAELTDEECAHLERIATEELAKIDS